MLVFQIVEKIIFLNKKVDSNLLKTIQKLNLISNGKTIEYPVEAIEFLKIISKKINKFNGGLLAFDYGYNNENKQKYPAISSKT